MRKCILALAALLGLTSAASAHIVQPVPFAEIGSLRDVHQAAFAIFQTYAAPAIPQITCNLVTGVASVGGPCTATTTCNGSGDDAVAFMAFNTWARTNQGSNQVVLTIPAGSDCVFNSGQPGPSPLSFLSNAFTAGINNLLIEGTGASMSEGTHGFWLGASGVCQAGIAAGNGCSARIQTVSAGSSTITLTAASLSAGYISRFAVDQWIMLGGLDIQGIWNSPYGFPPNQQYFEYRQITNVNAGTGVITLDRPITYDYLSTWPNYNEGNNFEADNGGPGTIWTVGTTSNWWGATLEIRGMTLNRPTAQIYAAGRYVTYRNVAFSGASGAIPTANEVWACYYCTWSDPSANIEVDKLIGTVILDHSTFYRMDFQSASTDLLLMSNSTVTGAMFGTPKASTITDSTFGTLRIGAYAYGVSTGDFTCTRCTVTTYEQGGITQDSRNPSDWSMSSGVISYANTTVSGAGPISRIMVPGANIRFQTNNYPFGWNIGPTFQVAGLTQDPTNVYVQTTEAGAEPTISNFPAATYVTFRSQSVPSFTCTDCLGAANLLVQDSTRGAPPGLPPQSWGKYDFAPTAAGDNYGWNMWGALISISINVTQAFTGSGGGELRMSQFNNIFLVDRTNYSSVTYGPTINTKVAGERIITPSGVTCDGVPGACSGDANLTWPTNGWLQDSIGLWMAGDLSGGGVKPLITLTVHLDQGVVP